MARMIIRAEREKVSFAEMAATEMRGKLNWHIHYGIEYMEHCIEEHQRNVPGDRSVYNFLLLLHASMKPLMSLDMDGNGQGNIGGDADGLYLGIYDPNNDYDHLLALPCVASGLTSSSSSSSSAPLNRPLLEFLDRYLPGGERNRTTNQGQDFGSTSRTTTENGSGAPDLFNVDYALRTCTNFKQTAACVRIYSNMGLYKDAVTQALKVGDVQAAKDVAHGVPDDAEGGGRSNFELRKRLWLMIAKHTVETVGNEQPRLAMKILDECPRVMDFGRPGLGNTGESNVDDDDDQAGEQTPILKIEDILPFFKDFVTINDFKDRIVDSLEAYDKKIDKLNMQIAEYGKAADKVHEDMDALRSRNLPVLGLRNFGITPTPDASAVQPESSSSSSTPASTGEVPLCALSGRSLEGETAFYVFPSGYAYLPSELYRYILPHLDRPKLRRARQLHRMLDQAAAARKAGARPSHPHWLSVADQEIFQEQLDAIIAAECPLTGSIMIDSVQKPLITDEELEKERMDWEI